MRWYVSYILLRHNPVFKEILWKWRTFANKVDPNIYRNILDLPLKDGKSANMLDHYICRFGYDTNIKIRDKDLKIKNLHYKTHAVNYSVSAGYQTQDSLISCCVLIWIYFTKVLYDFLSRNMRFRGWWLKGMTQV